MRMTAARIAVAALLASTVAGADSPKAPLTPVPPPPGARIQTGSTTTVLATDYVDLRLAWTSAISVEKLSFGQFAKPTRTRRMFGRFEVRPVPYDPARLKALVAEGDTLGAMRARPSPLAVQFDFPLLGDADVGEEKKLADLMRAHTSTATTVRVPIDDKTCALVVTDKHGGAPVVVALPDRVDCAALDFTPGGPPATGRSAAPATDRR